MTIKQFIEKSIEGGWSPRNDGEAKSFTLSHEDEQVIISLNFELSPNLADQYYWKMSFYEMVLDPLAWKAVGKVEGWAKVSKNDFGVHRKHKNYQRKMQFMIDALISGKTLEEYIETL